MPVGSILGRRSGLLASLALAVVWLGAATAAPVPLDGKARQAPRAHVAQPKVDLGVLAVGEVGTARFDFENRGNAVLVIHAVEPGCDCTLADFDETIPPGQSGAIRASLETVDLLGPVTKGIVVRTNDPERPQVMLTLKAHVMGLVALLPQRGLFLRKRAGEPWVGRLLIRKQPGEQGTLVVHDVTPSSDRLAVRVERLEQARPRGGGLPEGRAGDWLLEVRFRNDEPVFGQLRETVHFRTGLEGQPEVTVVVESNLEPPVHLSTADLTLVPDGKGGATGTLFASVRKGLDPTRLRVETTPSTLDVALAKSTSRMFKVEVRWGGVVLSNGAIVFKIGDEAFRLPVMWSGP